MTAPYPYRGLRQQGKVEQRPNVGPTRMTWFQTRIELGMRAVALLPFDESHFAALLYHVVALQRKVSPHPTVRGSVRAVSIFD